MNPAEAVRYLTDQGHRVPRFDEVDRVLETDIPFPVPALISEELTADASFELWHAARRHEPTTHLVPVLIGPEPMIDWSTGRDWSWMLHRIRANRKAALLPPDAVLRRMEEKLAERFSAQVLRTLRDEMAAIRPAWLVRAATATMPGHEVDAEHLPFLADAEPVRCVLLGCRPEEVPLYLGLGGWNGSPEPHEQAAILHGWVERYGVRVLHVGRGSVEMFVERPPARLDDVRGLLWEVFLYCYDAVFQDADDTFGHLRSMLAGPYWTFWWD